MDQELETYVEQIMDKQNYRAGIFGFGWNSSNLFDLLRGRRK